MHILMVVPKYPYPIVGGLERQAHILSRALVQRGIKATVLSGRFLQQQPDIELVEGVNVVRISRYERKYLGPLGAAIALLCKMVILRSHFDVVHIHNISGFGAWVLLISKLLKKPVLVKLPNVGSHGIPGIRAHALGTILLPIYRKSDAFVALCKESVKELIDIGYPTARILSVPNGVPISDFDRLPEEKRQSSPLKPVKIVFIGRIFPQKGLVDLLSIWDRVHSGAHGTVQLDIYGIGPQENELYELINKLSISDSVCMKGHILNVVPVLRDADIFVLPSYAEGNSNAILEAMASHLPIVSTRVGGTPALVGKEGDDFLVRPGDRLSLAERLLTLSSSEDLRVTLGEAMFSRAQRFLVSMQWQNAI
ncbi:MAG: glycosyltransferase family 4 protein [Gammaproteobacteria bacterium]|nr:glycosyltransferase family 4 protein [Gammaproteobacteria bacterium]